MKYGTHTKLVEEVIQFANSMQEIQKTVVPQDVSTINDIIEAKNSLFMRFLVRMNILGQI